MLFPEVEVTKSLSRNVLKYKYVKLNDDKKRVIDTNSAVEKRIKEIKQKQAAERQQENSLNEEFSEGLDASQIDALLDENAESYETDTKGVVHPSRNIVIKAETVHDSKNTEELFAEANAEIEQMKQAAVDEIERQKQGGFEEGKNNGYQKGYDEGMSQVDALRQELNTKSKQLDLEYEKKMQELEPALVETLTGVYNHVFSVDLDEFQGIVLHLLDNALHDIDSNKDYMIHVSSEDYKMVCDAKSQLLEGLASVNAIAEIIEDRTLTKNQCFIEMDGGIFDCSLGVELAELGKQLKLLSYTGEEE